ncbi:conserved hypothetical protein, secreted [Candidatus Magnetomorum sp. HK-1]|nr:conserved hypothetical protein, secreted [Candidatus Magnetomorum sp. HK-1]
MHPRIKSKIVRRNKHKLCFYGLLFILILCNFSFLHAASINPTIIQDLSSIDGYIVKAIHPNIYIIDLDSQDGIMTGDLFSVINEKESLTHPITENVIGKLDDIKAILRITQIKKGYALSALIKTINKKSILLPGDRVKRYDQLQTQFTDQSGNGKHLYTLLLKKLPHLSWKPYYNSAKINGNNKYKSNNLYELNLIFTNKGLEIKDWENRLIHYYPQTEIYFQNPVLKGESQLTNAYQPFGMSNSLQSFPSFQTLGKISGLVHTADFIVNDNKLFMAVAANKSISVYHVATNHITRVAETPIPIQHEPIYMNWWRPDSISNPHLTVTFWHNQDIESKILIFHEQSLKIIAYDINYHLASYDQNHDGNPEMLLGQAMDRENFWNYRTYRLLYFDQALRLSKRFKSPGTFTVYGSILGDMTGDGYLETIWVHNGILRIYQGKTFLYKTYVGDFPNQKITFDIDPVAKKTLFRTVSIYPKPLFHDLNKDNQPELFIIHSERPFLSQLGFSNQAVRTWIKCIRYQNKMFYSQRISRVFDSNIQALTIHNNDLILLIGVTDQDAEGQSHTSVIRWPMNKTN